MAAPLASRAGFMPSESPAVAVSADGRLAAVHQAGRVTMLDVPGMSAFAEVGVDPDAEASEVGWIGAPSKLLVLSRYAAHSTVHLLDPEGPRSIAEIRLEVPMRLAASVGGTALVVGAVGAAVIAATDTHLTVYPFPTRTVPHTAGAAGRRFVIATPGAIEEWDPETRLPTRKMKLPRAASITAVGGSDRVVWLMTQHEPQRIDVIPLMNRGQPRAHELPEPILRVASHPRSDMLAVIGAESGKLYAVDLEGRIPMHTLALAALDHIEAAAMLGSRNPLAIVAQAGRPVALVSLAGGEEDPTVAMSAGPQMATARLEVERSEPEAPAAVEPPAARSSLYGDGEDEVVEEPVVVEDVELAGLRWSGDVGAPAHEPAEALAASDEAAEADEDGEADEENTGDEPGVAGDEPGVASDEPRTAGDEPRAAGDEPRAASTGLRGLRDRAVRPAPARAPARTQSLATPRAPIARRSVETPRPRPAEPSARSASERFSAWRDQVRQTKPRDEAERGDAADEPVTHASDPALRLGAPSTHASDPALRLGAPSTHASDPALRLGTPSTHASDPALRLGPPTHASDPALRLGTPSTHDSDPALRLGPPTHASDPALRLGPPTHASDPALRLGTPTHASDPALRLGAPSHASDPALRLGTPSHGSDPALRLGTPSTHGSDPALHLEPAAPAMPAARPAVPRPVEPVRARTEPARPMLPRPGRAPIPPRAAAEPDEPKSWRDELVTWTRAVLAGAPPMLIAVPPIEALVARLEVATNLTAVLALLYGAHLVGERGVPPSEVSRLLGRSWDEALGRGELAQHALAAFVQSRVALSSVAQRFLDELPPQTGVVIGDPAHIALLGPCCVVAPDDEPLGAVAFRSLTAAGGAILASHDGSDRAALAYEARIYGAVAMRRLTRADEARNELAIYVVATDELAEQLGLPQLA